MSGEGKEWILKETIEWAIFMHKDIKLQPESVSEVNGILENKLGFQTTKDENAMVKRMSGKDDKGLEYEGLVVSLWYEKPSGSTFNVYGLDVYGPDFSRLIKTIRENTENHLMRIRFVGCSY